MKSQIAAAIAVVIFSSIAFCQVDTMRLVEVGSVTAPGTITNWYFEDLNADSIKEIILTTANSVNIYNGQTYAPIWSQSGFTNPKDLNFADINNDGLIDFSVKDTSHIYLIDPHHSTTIWTSPMLDSTYRCYTIGDRNGNSIIDLAIVTKEIFSRVGDPGNYDTCWISVSDGPNFLNNISMHVLMANYSYSQGSSPTIWGERRQGPNTIRLGKLSSHQQLNNCIILFSSYSKSGWSPSGGAGGSGGNLYLIDGDSLRINYIYPSGSYLYDDLISTVNSAFLFILSKSTTYLSGMPCVTTYKNVSTCYAESTMNYSYEIWSAFRCSGQMIDWQGFIVADINPSMPGQEFCYTFDSLLYLLTYPGFSPIWTTENLTGLHSVKCIYSSILNTELEKYILCKTIYSPNSYNFYSGENGSLRWVLPTGSIALNGTTDLTQDNTDELYYIDGNSIHFCALAPRTGIDDPAYTPSAFFLSSNYPNPFNASTMIEYGLPEQSPVKIEIFNILGRKVQTLVDETQSAGYHQVTWRGEDMPSGTYFYRIQAGDNTQTRKCLLLK